MKIGVALCGNGHASLAAYPAVLQLKEWGLPVSWVSCCSLGSLSMVGQREIFPEERESFLKKTSCLLEKKEKTFPLTINAFNLDQGSLVLFSKDSAVKPAGGMEMIQDYREEDALRATLSPYRGIQPYTYNNKRLCDAAVKYGCPYFALKLQGMERIVAITFPSDEKRASPEALMMDRLCQLTARQADFALALTAAQGGSLTQQIKVAMDQHKEALTQALLFPKEQKQR